MGKCNLKNKQELYNEIVASYAGLKAYEVNDLATAVRDVIFTKLPDMTFKKYSAVSDFVQGKTFGELFTKLSPTLDTFAFNNPDMYESKESLRLALIDHGVSSLFALALVDKFTAFKKVYLSKVATNTRSPIKKGKEEVKAWYEAPLQLLYGDAQENGDFTVPDAVLFNMMVVSYRFAGSVPSMLNQKEIGELVYGDGDAEISPELYELFKDGGVNRNTLIMQIGTEIYRSMNIRATIEEREDITFDPTTVDRADGLAQRIKYGLGLLAVAGMGSEIKLDSKPLFDHNVVKVVGNTINEAGQIEEVELFFPMIQVPAEQNEDETLTEFGKLSLLMSNFTADTNLILGDSESAYEPSDTPIKHVKVGIRNSIFDIANKVSRTIRTLQANPWVKNSGFELFDGVDKQTIRELAGWKDSTKVQIDNRGAQEAKNAAIDREIDNLVKYNQLGRLERFFVPYKAMNTNRLVQLGPITPQNSILHRNLITPEGALNTEISTKEMFDLFSLAVAQAFDQDIDKTDLEGGLQLFEKIVADAQNANSPLAKAIVAFKAKDFTQLNTLLLDVNEQYGAGPGILKGIPALSAYLDALSEDGSKFDTFTTDITLEVDGVTNGFAISIMQFAGGLFNDGLVMTKDGRTKLNQIGITLSTQEGSMGSRFKAGFKDAYTEFGYSMKSVIDSPLLFQGKVTRRDDNDKLYVTKAYRDLFDIKTLNADVKKALNALQVIGFDISQDSIIRKMAKTPFMVYNYGAMFASISRELAVEVSEMYREKVVDMQEAYTQATDKTQALANAVELFSALAVFGEKAYSKEKIKELLDAGTLIELRLDKQNKVRDSIILMYKPIVAHAADEVLGDLTKYRAAFIEAAEIQFMIFNNQLEKAVDGLVEGTESFAKKFTQLDEAQKTELIKNTLLTVYPQFKGPFAGKTAKDSAYIKDAIDLIKVRYTHQDSNVVKVPRRGGGSYSVQVRTLEFEAPGASAVIRPVQNIDSVLLSLSIKATNGGFSPIHDAMDAPLGIVHQSANTYNSDFVGVNESFDVFGQVSARLFQTFEALTAKEQEEVSAEFFENAFVNKGKPEEWKTELKQSMSTIDTYNTKNKAARSELFTMLKEEGTKVEQMYISTSVLTVGPATQFKSDAAESLQVESDFASIAEEAQLFTEIQDRLAKLFPGVTATRIQDLRDKYGSRVLGRAVGSLAQYAQDAKLDTLPHEYAHIYVDMLESTTFMNKVLTRIEKTHKVSRADAKELLVTQMGQDFAADLGATSKVTADVAILKLADRVWQKLVDFVEFFTGSTFTFAENTQRMMNEASERFRLGLSGDTVSTKPKPGFIKMEVDSILRGNPVGAQVLRTIIEAIPSAVLTGSTALAAQGNIYRATIDSLHDLDFRIPTLEYNKAVEAINKIYGKRLVSIYTFPISKDNMINTFIVAPEGTTITELTRYGKSRQSRVVSYSIVDNTTKEVVGTYEATVGPADNAIRSDMGPIERSYLPSEIKNEAYWGQKAIIVDLMESSTVERSVEFKSKVLDMALPMAHADSIFEAKNSLSADSTPRGKDIRDFVLFKPSEDTGITDPLIFKEPAEVLGSSPEDVLESVNDIFDNLKLTTNARKIFNKLATYTNAYVSEAEHAKETAHLDTVWNDIILKVIANIEGVTVSAGQVEGPTVGGYNVTKNSIRLNLSKYIASTYTEQSDQEVFTHESLHPVIHAVLKTGTPIKGSLQALQKFAREHITVEDFLSKDADGNVAFKTDPTLERESAQQQYDYFIGPFHTNSLGEEVASTLEEFVVGALTNKHLINALTNMQQPAKNKFFTGQGFIQQVGNAISTLVDMFLRKYRQDKIPSSVHAEIFELVQQLAGAQERQRQHVYYEMSIKAKDKLYSKFKDGVKLGLKTLGKDGKGKSFIPNTAFVLENLPEALKVASTQEAFTKAFAALPTAVQDSSLAYLVKEATIGTTDVRVEKMLLLSKHLVEAQRKSREHAVIGKIQKMFLTPFKEITKNQHTALTKVILRLDLSTLMYSGEMSATEIVDLLRNPAALKNVIASYELNLNIANNVVYAQHTKALAQIITRRSNTKHNAALNANTIHLMHILKQQSKVVNKAEVKMLDTYVTLLAIQMATESTLATALEVIDKEQAAGKENGFTFLLKHHNDFKLETKNKLFGTSPIQMRKGYLAHVADPHVNVVAATEAEAIELYKQGYTKLGKVTEYDGIDSEGLNLYVTKYHVEPTKVAGVLSYTQLKASGTSVFEMFARKEEYQMIDEISGESVPNAAKIHVAIRDFAAQQDALARYEEEFGMSSKYQLLPIRDELSNIVDYRIELPYAKMEEIYKGDSLDMDIDKVFGRMGMHLVDKVQSEQINKNAVDFLVKDYSENMRGAKHEFIDLFDPYYYKEYYAGLPRSLKRLVKQGALVTKKKGGKEKLSFPIRRDYVLTFFGHKRLSAANIKLISGMPRVQFAFKQFEESWQSIVALGVKNVIIKEVAGVPGANMVSNFFVSMVSGMSPLAIKKYWGAGWKNIELFKHEAKELAEIQLELQNADLTTTKNKQLKARYFELRSRLAENPVIKLINMGLFTSISEDVELREFDYLTKFANSLSGVKKHIPETMQSAARVAYMTESTQIFKELHHFTTTMDFVARYGMFQHLTIKKGLSEEDALSQVFDAFVLYDKPLGPKLDYVNKMGLGLFVKFWLFIQRYLYKQAKREPANVAMLLAMQNVTGINVPDVYDSAMMFGNWLPPIGGPQKVFENVFYIPFTDQIEDITGLPVDPI